MRFQRKSRLLGAIAIGALMWVSLGGAALSHSGDYWHATTTPPDVNCNRTFQGKINYPGAKPATGMYTATSGHWTCPLGEARFRFYEAGAGYHYMGYQTFTNPSQPIFHTPYTYNAYSVWDGFTAQGRVYATSGVYEWSTWSSDLVF